MQVSDFPTSYKLKMIRAYPIIAQMDADEEYFATELGQEHLVRSTQVLVGEDAPERFVSFLRTQQ